MTQRNLLLKNTLYYTAIALGLCSCAAASNEPGTDFSSDAGADAGDVATSDAGPQGFGVEPGPGFGLGPGIGPVPVPDRRTYLASREVEPSHLLVQGEQAYWIDKRGGKTTVKTNSHANLPSESVTNLSQTPLASASDASGLYFASGAEHILYTSLSDHQSSVFIESVSTPLVIALDSENVYWATKVGCIFQAPKNGGESEKLACEGGTVNSLAVVESTIFWTTEVGQLYGMKALAGSPAQKLATGVIGSGIVVDQSGIFWADTVERTLLRYDFEKEEVFKIATAEPSVVSISQDRLYIYFSSSWDGGVKRVLKTGGTPVEVLSIGNEDPTEVVVSGGFVYWLNETEGAVLRLPRP